MKKIKCVFFGTPDFSVPTLEMLMNHPLVEIECVVSMPDKAVGRSGKLVSPQVIQFAKQNKLKTFQTENINKEESFSKLVQDSDVFIVLAFAQFLGKKILDMPKLGCFNIHTSILPKYRGAAPIQYAILNGDKETGVSIQKMVKKMDAGDVCFKKMVKIEDDELGGQLYTKLKFEAALCCNEFIYKLHKDDLEFEKQDESKVSFAPSFKREDGFLDFASMKLDDAYNKVRALYPWPGTFSFLGTKRFKFLKVSKSDVSLKPGQCLIKGTRIFLGCQDGALEVLELQLEGKKATTAQDFVNGLQTNQRQEFELQRI